MARYVWKGPGTKVRIIFGCFALIAILVLIDGLLKGEILRALAGAVFAWPFVTFMIRGVPVPEEWARSWQEQRASAMSGRRGSSTSLHWCLIALGLAFGAVTILATCMVLFASIETLESYFPSVARGISRAAKRDSEFLERLGYAVLFGFCGFAALFGAWKRARE